MSSSTWIALVADDLLDPGHLLDLEAHRVEALEDQRHDRTERHPPVRACGAMTRAR